MKPLATLTMDELTALKGELSKRINDFTAMGLSLNMTRGVPSAKQLDLSKDMLGCLSQEDYRSENGTDCRQYGGVDGIYEMKKIFADILDVSPEEVIVGGNSSLAMMFDNIASNVSHGVRDGRPWLNQGEVKFLCPVPGYDRHFAICNYFHITMIPIDFTDDVKGAKKIADMVASDPMIKGVWCVPVFSNPTGIVYSPETVNILANLRPAAPDFRLYWDNAYAIHHFRGERIRIPNILRECEAAGNPNMPLMFTSFSKISFAGAGVACIASSKSNCDYIRSRLTIQTIGPDKLNQLRHVRFFGSAAGVERHMEKMAEIIRPKFDLVQKKLSESLGGLGIATWTNPDGGYFVSFNAPEGCAKAIVDMCAKAGVALTSAGATFPYGYDPHDSNIRIAPTFPPLEELDTAMDVFCAAVKLTAVDNLLKARS